MMGKQTFLRRICHAVVSAAVVFGWFSILNPVYAEQTLRVGITSFSTSRGNPFATTSGLPPMYSYSAFLEGLTRVNNKAEALPMLAERWESETETTWLFYLRKGALFSNGEPANAEAVVFTHGLLISQEGAAYPIAVEQRGIESIEVVDETTVRVRTSQPDILLPNKIAALKIVPPKYWTDVGKDGFAATPIGSGPFMIEDWTTARMALVRSPSAWRQPIVDALELISAAEPATRVQGLLSGRLHIAVQLGPDDVPLIESAGHKVALGLDPSMQVVAFITEKDSPLTDIRVRRALNYAVDREAMAQGLLGGHVQMATQTTPKIAFGWDPDIPPWPYDPDRAKALLAEAGYADGFSFHIEILLGSASYSALVYQQVAVDLAKVGVTMSIRRIPATQYARGVYQGQWAGEAIGMDYGVNPSLDALIPLVRHSCLWMKPWFCEESILPLMAQAGGTFDLDERRRLTQKVMRRQLEFVPSILLYETARFDGLNAKVENFLIEVGHINYDEISLSE
ncbi:MAG: ABC transporter substrate-binding protein [Rhodospirillaceae bacterium]|jgi:peptide/nickel transport system substrate-binding protein|nr:ABC transporter substrate-binding protein [Rhodospirillaceae bacterium]